MRMKERFQPVGLWAAVAANALVIGVFIYAWLLEDFDFDRYRTAVQEDEYLEWATFWGFMIAAGAFVLTAVRRRRRDGGIPWFEAGLAVFCFLFAMEEISWAQRIFAYRPPTYFLEHNFQQEPNFHNVISTSLRKLTLKSIIGGYGVLLPVVLAMPLPALRRLVRRLGIVVPPVEFAPGFALAFQAYSRYPWDYTGEIVELMLAAGFVCFAWVELHRASRDQPTLDRRATLGLTAGCALSLVLGLATAAAVRNQQSVWPENIAAAEVEIAALRNDFLAHSDPERQRFPTKCGLHKRVYSFVEKYDRDELRRGDYGALQAQGMPPERAEFFIDPWNAPYWVRDRCRKSTGRRAIFIYSFGPNRKRDSSLWEVLGDDIGAYVFLEPGEAADE